MDCKDEKIKLICDDSYSCMIPNGSANVVVSGDLNLQGDLKVHDLPVITKSDKCIACDSYKKFVLNLNNNFICQDCLANLIENYYQIRKCNICKKEKKHSEGLAWENDEYKMFMCSNCIFEKLTFLEAMHSLNKKH